jgi:hypothetical protein
VAVSGVNYVQGLDSGEYDFTHVVSTVIASGPTTIYSCPTGRRLRLRWIYAQNDPGSTATPLIKVFLGAEEKFRMYALSKRQFVTGPVNGDLIIDLSEAASVAVTALLEEV